MSPLEKKFSLLWVHGVKGTGDLLVEHKFHPSRRWRFDFAHLPTKVAIEIEGGTGVYRTPDGKKFRGRHATVAGYQADCEKYNAATFLGWRVFRLTGKMLNAPELEKIKAFISQQPHLN